MRIALCCATGLLAIACRTAQPPQTLVYGLPLRSFTKFGIDTFWVKYNAPLFGIRQSQAFLHDWQQLLLVADTLDAKSFGYRYVRLCIEVPAPTRTIFLDWGGGHFLYNGRAYKMPDAGIAVLSKYFPDSPKKLLDPELRKRSRSRYGHDYHKTDYLPLLR